MKKDATVDSVADLLLSLDENDWAKMNIDKLVKTYKIVSNLRSNVMDQLILLRTLEQGINQRIERLGMMGLDIYTKPTPVNTKRIPKYGD